MIFLTDEIRRAIAALEITTRRALGAVLSGDSRTRRLGLGFDFDQLREYHEGDEVRFIDWNSSARSGTLMVRQFRDDRTRTVMLVVDGSGSMGCGSGEHLKYERARECAIALALAAVQTRDRVGLCLYAGGVIKYMPPRTGRLHALAIAEALYAHTPSGPSALGDALRQVMQRVKGQTLLICISDFIDDQYVRSLKMASGAHELLALRILDERERAVPIEFGIECEDPETGELLDAGAMAKAFERTAQEYLAYHRATIRRAAVPVLELTTHTSFVPQLVHFFALQGYAR